ncbi:MAG: HEPN domain-containing protein [Desulfobacterales bacterium]|uniref:HEPN domain-containing protein n=1 Tax=Candidatus Desulfatibia vada TaxID=2841696 RepID=A0A8J6NTR3_9BACT|nr:HEPN domain-containing protein [Candidatus Desulfatibia vada]MBL6972195.1 HEPN domain-containing protein [Desulfobacterales bacterium]
MKDETKIWMKYADENLKSARLLLDGSLFNACLQNIQQSVEKSLNALLVEFSIKLIKTHSIGKLTAALTEHDVDVDITEDECDLLDTIYLPSKYPLGGVIPDFEPDADICRQCLSISKKVIKSVKDHLS